MKETFFDIPDVKPFLKWAGGKRQILRHLLKFLPSDVRDRTYREPFLGGGSMFFALDPKRAFLSDANEHLIMCYQYVREDPDLVYSYLREHAKNDCEKYYYKIRDVYNSSSYSAAQAARFIYLNKTCYNGIFRVNQKGLFNVPYGRYKTTSIPSLEHLRKVSKSLKSVKLFTSQYEAALKNIEPNDFIYLDPPYPPLNSTSCFTHYTSDKFSDNDQEKLAEVVKGLHTAGCFFMISNANTQRIQNLYKKFYKYPVPVTRFITCKKIRHKVSELIITNYEMRGK